MTLRNTPALLGAVIVLSLTVVGCATKKNVREAIAPVQDQANKTDTHVGALQKQTDENKQSIGDLDRQVATADEKATDAGKKAAEAAEAAAKANAAAAEAAQRADAANSAVQQTQAKLDTSLQNLDNYKLVTTQPVYFGLNRVTLTKDEQQKLDDAVQKLTSMKMYMWKWKATRIVPVLARITASSAANGRMPWCITWRWNIIFRCGRFANWARGQTSRTLTTRRERLARRTVEWM